MGRRAPQPQNGRTLRARSKINARRPPGQRSTFSCVKAFLRQSPVIQKAPGAVPVFPRDETSEPHLHNRHRLSRHLLLVLQLSLHRQAFPNGDTMDAPIDPSGDYEGVPRFFPRPRSATAARPPRKEETRSTKASRAAASASASVWCEDLGRSACRRPAAGLSVKSRELASAPDVAPGPWGRRRHLRPVPAAHFRIIFTARQLGPDFAQVYGCRGIFRYAKSVVDRVSRYSGPRRSPRTNRLAAMTSAAGPSTRRQDGLSWNAPPDSRSASRTRISMSYFSTVDRD
jgi:hypothetical protein